MFITCLDIDFAEADPKANCEATWDKIEIFFRSNMAGLKDKTKSKLLDIPQKYFILQNGVVFCTFYPNLPIFLHRYICHICDILQLWCRRLIEKLRYMYVIVLS